MVTPTNLHPLPTPVGLLNHDNSPLFTLDARRSDAIDKQVHVKSFFVPKIMITNVRSLVPKIDEVQKFLNRNYIFIAFTTKTWLRPAIVDSVIDIPGYTVLRKDRISDNHGGACLYLRNNNSMYTELRNLTCCSEHEILLVKLRPKCLSRGFSGLIIVVVYYPHWSDFENNLMRDHLFQLLRIAD